MPKVLIIEDNPDNLRLMTKILQRGGYEVASAVNGLEGVAMGIQDGYAFIVLDINLPDIDGLEVARRIRGHANGGDVPIIAITSYAMRGDMDHILGAGCNGYFEKPINPLNILDEIHRLIGR